MKAYEGIVHDMETLISESRFRVRERLPSVRELCDTYRCSKNTAVKAYDILKGKQLIYSVPQSGYYIVEKRLEIEKTNTAIIDFSRGNPLLENIHIPDLRHCLDRAVDICQTNSFAGHKLYGVPSLRTLLPKYLADFQVFTATDNIFVNRGVQQALNILNQIPFPNKKDTILIEQPTFR